MKKQKQFDSCVMNNLFPEGFHKIVCADLNIATLKINNNDLKLYDFTFFDTKLNESIWIQLKISEKNCDQIYELISILLNKPIKYALNNFSSFKELLQKECLIYVRRNLAGVSEIENFIPLM